MVGFGCRRGHVGGTHALVERAVLSMAASCHISRFRSFRIDGRYTAGICKARPSALRPPRVACPESVVCSNAVEECASLVGVGRVAASCCVAGVLSNVEAPGRASPSMARHATQENLRHNRGSRLARHLYCGPPHCLARGKPGPGGEATAVVFPNSDTPCV